MKIRKLKFRNAKKSNPPPHVSCVLIINNKFNAKEIVRIGSYNSEYDKWDVHSAEEQYHQKWFERNNKYFEILEWAISKDLLQGIVSSNGCCGGK